MPFRTVIVAAALLAAAAPAAAQRVGATMPTNLRPEILALACAPSLSFEAPPVPIRVTGGQDSFVRRMYAPGDLITINAGSDNGIEVGQEYYTRRALTLETGRVDRDNPALVRTTGWVRVYAVDKQMSLATITHACHATDVNDYLEPFVLPQAPPPALDRPMAQRENYGRIQLGNDRRRSFGRGDFFVVDRGSDHGVTVGSQFVVYRDKRQAENFLYDLGEAVAVDVRPESSTLQITLSRDAMIAGDYVALRK
jgi:hypothetical protein